MYDRNEEAYLLGRTVWYTHETGPIMRGEQGTIVGFEWELGRVSVKLKSGNVWNYPFERWELDPDAEENKKQTALLEQILEVTKAAKNFEKGNLYASMYVGGTLGGAVKADVYPPRTVTGRIDRNMERAETIVIGDRVGGKTGFNVVRIEHFRDLNEDKKRKVRLYSTSGTVVPVFSYGELVEVDRNWMIRNNSVD